jgi:DNA-binding MarR family transcriptional regulator
MSGRTPETPPITVAFLLAQVGARAAQELGRMLSPLHLTPPDAGILRLLSLSPGISQQELANRLNMHASRLVAVIDALEERALVARAENSEDRRIYSLHLTEAGKEALHAIARVARAHEDALCAGLSAAERRQLARLLQKIAGRQGLAPGVHPGYRNLRTPEKDACPAEPSEKS